VRSHSSLRIRHRWGIHVPKRWTPCALLRTRSITKGKHGITAHMAVP
jgi:hypothetical protein